MPSLFMLIIYCALFTGVVVSYIDTLLRVFLRVMSLCMLFLTCQMVSCALLLCTLCTILNNK